MKEFLSHYESFAFRAFTFQRRATPLEYWAVIPVIWILIFWTFTADVREVYGFLIERRIPPMNPLYYESFLIFFVTLIPRMAVNIRRLHDRDKSGFWALLPGISIFSSAVLFSALLGAMMNSSLTGISDGPDEMRNITYPLLLYVGAPEVFWSEMFSIAVAFEKAGSEAVSGLLAEIYAHSGAVDVRRYVDNVTNEIEGNTGHTVGFVFVAMSLVFTPIITGVLHLIFNVLPSSTEDNIYGPAQIAELHYKKKTDDRHNPMAGYAHLFEETKEEKAKKREAHTAEVRALYQQRVLGKEPQG